MIPNSNKGGADLGLGFPDMTALLDVIFILLIFLLLTSQVVPEALTLELPQTERGTQTQAKDDSITISVDGLSKTWAVNQHKFDQWLDFRAGFIHALNARPTGGKPQIFIAGDKDTSLQELLKLFDLLQEFQLNATEILVKSD